MFFGFFQSGACQPPKHKLYGLASETAKHNLISCPRQIVFNFIQLFAPSCSLPAPKAHAVWLCDAFETAQRHHFFVVVAVVAVAIAVAIAVAVAVAISVAAVAVVAFVAVVAVAIAVALAAVVVVVAAVAQTEPVILDALPLASAGIGGLSAYTLIL